MNALTQEERSHILEAISLSCQLLDAIKSGAAAAGETWLTEHDDNVRAMLSRSASILTSCDAAPQAEGGCKYCGSKGYVPGDPEGAPIEDCPKCSKPPAPTEAAWPEELVASIKLELNKWDRRKDNSDIIAVNILEHVSDASLLRVGALKRPMDRDCIAEAMMNTRGLYVRLDNALQWADALIAADARGELSK